MKLKNVKGIIWDLDGTLIDSLEIFEAILTEAVKEHGHTMPSREFIIKNYHGSLNETVERLLNIDSSEELSQVVNTFLKNQEHHYAGDLEMHLFTDASNLARRAAHKNITQLIITNRNHDGLGSASPKYIVGATTLASYIHEVYAGDEVDFRKPDKRSTKDWLEKNDLQPNEVVVIGDQFVDAQLALNIGARALLIERNGEVPHLSNLTEKDSKAITIVTSLEEVELS